MGSSGAEAIQKTKQALEMLKNLGCEEELTRVLDSKKIRAGKGKMRNRRYVMRRGPLVIYSEDNGIVRAVRNSGRGDRVCGSPELAAVGAGGQLWSVHHLDGGRFQKAIGDLRFLQRRRSSEERISLAEGSHGER